MCFLKHLFSDARYKNCPQQQSRIDIDIKKLAPAKDVNGWAEIWIPSQDAAVTHIVNSPYADTWQKTAQCGLKRPLVPKAATSPATGQLQKTFCHIQLSPQRASASQKEEQAATASPCELHAAFRAS